MMQEPTAQHTVNAAALVVPLVSSALSWPEVLTIILTCLGILWYLIQMGDWAVKKCKIFIMIRQSSRRVAKPILEDHEIERKCDDDHSTYP